MISGMWMDLLVTVELNSLMKLDCQTRPKKEQEMANRNLTVKLTNEQQKQISDATGKHITELKIDLASTGHLSEKDLEQVAGGCASGKHISKSL